MGEWESGRVGEGVRAGLPRRGIEALAGYEGGNSSFIGGVASVPNPLTRQFHETALSLSHSLPPSLPHSLSSHSQQVVFQGLGDADGDYFARVGLTGEEDEAIDLGSISEAPAGIHAGAAVRLDLRTFH